MPGLVEIVATLAVVAGVVYFASQYVTGVHVRDVRSAVGVAIGFAILNVLLSWLITGILTILTAPAQVLMLNAFRVFFHFLIPLVVNAILLWIVDVLYEPFRLDGIVPPLILAALVGVAMFVLRLVFV